VLPPAAVFPRVSQQIQTDAAAGTAGSSVRRAQMRTTNRHKVAIRAVVAAVACTALLLPGSARATSPKAHPQIKRGGIVNVVSRIGGSWVSNFNPGSSSAINGTTGWLYAPLLQFNQAQPGKINYFLAKSYKWSNGGHTLTFNLRPGLKWSDGQPLTSADVLYSFKLAKAYKSFAFCNGCWQSGVTSVTAPNATTVVVHIGKLDSTLVYYIGDAGGYIVPKHVFAKISGDPTKFTNSNPVTSGPFKLGHFGPQVYTFVRNPNFFMANHLYIDGLRFPAFSGNDSADLAVINGEIDWAGDFIPNAQQAYVSKDPKYNHYWFPSLGGPVPIYLNNSQAPFNNVHVRRAISDALDRTTIGKVGEVGYANPANGALIGPQFVKAWGDPASVKSAPLHANIAAAKAELAQAGPIDLSQTFKLNVVDGWTDWVTSVTIAQQELAQIGIKVQVQPLQFGAWFDAIQTGRYDMSIGWTTAGPTSPFILYRATFWSRNSAPIGTIAPSNWERYSNPQMDSLITKYNASTSLSKQQSYMKAMEKIVARDVPVVGLFWGPWWYEYNTKRFVGWPNAKHPYDHPSPWQSGPNLDVVLHIHER
jgi:peptide/nickel transport system substrate-binding protein